MNVEIQNTTVVFISIAIYCVAVAAIMQLRTSTTDIAPSSSTPINSIRSVSSRALAEEASEETETSALLKVQTSLLPGELPGYTGWARPVYTLAPTFEIVTSSWRDPANRWIVNLKSTGCNLDQPEHTKFYARAYGPAIVMGRATEYEHCHYDIVFDFFDAGTYWVEIVVTFSHGQIPRHFPLFKAKNETYDDAPYEGYYVPGFPQMLEVGEKPVAEFQKPTHTRTCTINDVLVTDAHEEVGRWVMKDRPSYDVVNTDETMTDISLDGYESGGNAIGALLGYHFISGCSIPKHPPDVGKKTVVLFVGDHTFRAQHSYMDQKHSNQESIEMRLVGNSGGMYKMSEQVYSEITKRSRQAEEAGAELVIFFNTGLHDIFQLCSGKRAESRSKHEELIAEDYACVDHYKDLLLDLASFLVNLPTKPHIFFQTTHAGWPKWGNYGTAWEPDQGQPYPLSPDFVLQFNEIAVNRLQQVFADNITILDGYWTTLARPDNRLVNPNLTSSLEHFLIHPGHEVQKAFLHVWTVVLNEIVSNQMIQET